MQGFAVNPRPLTRSPGAFTGENSTDRHKGNCISSVGLTVNSYALPEEGLEALVGQRVPIMLEAR